MFSALFSIIATVALTLLFLAKIALLVCLLVMVAMYFVAKKTFFTLRKPPVSFLPKELKAQAPRRRRLRNLLNQAHKLYKQNLKNYPELGNDINFLWESYLEELNYCKGDWQWQECTERFINSMPNTMSNFDDALSRLQSSYLNWTMAEQEVKNGRSYAI